jgi:hypothetical protein
MSSHPGSEKKDAIQLAEYIRDLGYMPQQVQDFYPTPSTLSTCMYYTGYDPVTMEHVYTPVSPHEKAMQRALIQYKDADNYELVKEALIKNNRMDLIGFDKKCLIPPRQIKHNTVKKQTDRPSNKQMDKGKNAVRGERNQSKNKKGGKSIERNYNKKH